MKYRSYYSLAELPGEVRYAVRFCADCQMPDTVAGPGLFRLCDYHALRSGTVVFRVIPDSLLTGKKA